MLLPVIEKHTFLAVRAVHQSVLPLNEKDHRFAQRPLWGMSSIITNKVFHLSGLNFFHQ
jgi:hypothetical protein